jgi:serine/threonine protein kinase
MSRTRRLKVGDMVGDLTVLKVIAAVRGRHPVYLVWNHTAWCPMVCKGFSTRRRATREAAALEAMAHPNIIRPLGIRPGGLLLLEVLDGPTLDHEREQAGGRLSVSHAIRAVMHVGAALEHVHSRGYAHLDVKPGNVIVMDGRPVLFDFGTARPLGDRPLDAVVGTTPYIAPEVVELRGFGPASDVFSLGVTFFEMLTGELPFADETRDAPYPQLAPPKALRILRPSVPHELEALVMACLAVDPADRPRLRTLLPALNDLIRHGARMWPDGFSPAVAA